MDHIFEVNCDKRVFSKASPTNLWGNLICSVEVLIFPFDKNKIKWWFMVKHLWLVIQHDPSVFDQGKIKNNRLNFMDWEDRKAQVAIRVALANVFFDIYISDVYNAKLWSMTGDTKWSTCDWSRKGWKYNPLICGTKVSTWNMCLHLFDFTRTGDDIFKHIVYLAYGVIIFRS